MTIQTIINNIVSKDKAAIRDSIKKNTTFRDFLEKVEILEVDSEEDKNISARSDTEAANDETTLNNKEMTLSINWKI